MTAVFLAKMASPRLRAVVSSAVSLLAGIPSVVYGLVGMLVLVPGIRHIFRIPDGSGLLAAIIVLAIMILPSIINVAMTALEAVPREYEDAHWHWVLRRWRRGFACPSRRRKAASPRRWCWA